MHISATRVYIGSKSLWHYIILGKDPATKLDEFLEKCQRGGEHEIDKKKSNFRVQGMFFNNCIDIN